MLTTSTVQVTILGVLILITLANVGLFAYPFGWQVDAATALNNSKASAIDGNKTITIKNNLVNISATTPLFVSSPQAEVFSSGGFTTNSDGQLVIYVFFNKPVDRSTVVPGTSLILAMPRNANAPVTLTWGFDDDILRVVSNDRLNDLCTFQPDCFWTLRLDGTAPNSIRAVDGTLLNEGLRDYWTGFVIVG